MSGGKWGFTSIQTDGEGEGVEQVPYKMYTKCIQAILVGFSMQ